MTSYHCLVESTANSSTRPEMGAEWGRSMFGFDRITADANILGGKACIRGMRISVALVVNLVANGMNVEEIIAEYPDLEPEDVHQALKYAAWTVEDTIYVPVGIGA